MIGNSTPDQENKVASVEVEESHNLAEMVRDPDMMDVEKEYAQIALDAIKSEDVLQHIPVVKTVVAAAKLIDSFRDASLIKKLLRFLRGFAATSQWERDDMVSRMEADPSYARRVSTHVMEILDRIDSHRKPEMLAAVYVAFLRKQIDIKMWLRLTAAVETIPTFAIGAVRKLIERSQDIDDETYQYLANSGLANVASGFGALAYQPNGTANQFVLLNLDKL